MMVYLDLFSSMNRCLSAGRFLKSALLMEYGFSRFIGVHLRAVDDRLLEDTAPRFWLAKSAFSFAVGPVSGVCT